MSRQNVRWGLLSTTRINERLIPPIRACERSEFVAVASRTQSKADAYASEWGIPKAYGSYQAMLYAPVISLASSLDNIAALVALYRAAREGTVVPLS